MAIFEKTIRNKNFDKLLRKLEQEIPDSSWSADLEAGSDFKEGDARCSVRVFERYSMPDRTVRILEHGQCQTQAVAAHHAVPFKYTDTAPGIALFEITACL